MLHCRRVCIVPHMRAGVLLPNICKRKRFEPRAYLFKKYAGGPRGGLGLPGRVTYSIDVPISSWIGCDTCVKQGVGGEMQACLI